MTGENTQVGEQSTNNMASGLQYVTVNVPHQPRKGFRREFEENPAAVEPNCQRVRRELKSLQDRLSTYYLRHREERERHRFNLLRNLNQLDLYWFEWDSFDKAMFRFRCTWMNHLVDETIEQLLGATAGVLKDLWGMEYEVERILLKDLLVIKQNLGKEKRNNGVNLLIEHFNNKVTYSLRTTYEYSQKSLSDYMKFLKDVEYISNELIDRLILDTSMPEYEKSMLGKELYQFRQDAKAHIQEVDNFNYELRELLRGTNLKKLRGLSKDEYKERIHEIIAFIEEAEVPLRVFKTVGFAMQKTEELSAETAGNVGVYGVSGPLEKDYPADEP